MQRWVWDIAGFIDMQQLARYYADENPNIRGRFSNVEDDDTILWHHESQKVMSTLYAWHEGRHTNPDGGYMQDQDFDNYYFVKNHTSEEIVDIANDLSSNRGLIPSFDKKNKVHMHIIDKFSEGLKMLAFLK